MSKRKAKPAGKGTPRKMKLQALSLVGCAGGQEAEAHGARRKMSSDEAGERNGD